MALPHIQNSTAGRNLFDPVHTNIFEVYFILPEALRAEFGTDEALITEHVTKISGLDALEQGLGTLQQKFMGTTRTYLNSKLDSTSAADIQVEFTLNLRNATDNYIYKMFRAWRNLEYNLQTGEISTRAEYTAPWMKISIGNRKGDIIREIVFKDVMMHGNLEGFAELAYETQDPLTLNVHFASDWWTDEVV